MKLPATLIYICLEVMSYIESTVSCGNGVDTYRHVHMLNLAAFPEIIWRVRLHPFRMLELHGGGFQLYNRGLLSHEERAQIVQ
jgi:hypothetical protein